MQVQESADLLLLLGWSDAQFKGVLTGKLIEYRGAKRLILSLNNHLEDTSKLVIDYKAGFFARIKPKFLKN